MWLSPGFVVEQQFGRRAEELCHYNFSLLWPLINNFALVLFSLSFSFFSRETCLFCLVCVVFSE